MANNAAPAVKRKRTLITAMIIVAIIGLAAFAINAFGAPGKKGQVHTLSDADFHARIASGVSMVDFWATWCGPCKMQAPIVETLAGRFAGKIMVAKLDVDENEKAAEEFRVDAIPTLIMFKDGKEVRRFVGLEQEETLAKALTALLR